MGNVIGCTNQNKQVIDYQNLFSLEQMKTEDKDKEIQQLKDEIISQNKAFNNKTEKLKQEIHSLKKNNYDEYSAQAKTTIRRVSFEKDEI